MFSKMIKDSDSNFVFFSDKLNEKFPQSAARISKILNDYNIKFGFLKGTSDIWCRDYMPVQISESKFIQFKYEPSYLNDTDENSRSRSDTKNVYYKNNIEPVISDLNIDGGNVVKYHDKVILTNRIFKENPDCTEDEVLHKLEELFESNVIIIPSIKDDVYGHADSYVRFCDGNRIIVSDLNIEYKYISEGFKKVATENNFEILELPRFEYQDKSYNKKYPESAIGIYLNYLEIGNLIVFPIFGVDGNKDDEAVKTVKEIFPKKVVETIEINEIARYGGLMNCISWNIMI